MAVKRERSAERVELPEIAALVDARWFAGKSRTVAALEPVREITPADADGASLVILEISYEDGGSERYSLPLRGGTECAGDDPLWSALARSAGVAGVRGRSRLLADDLSNTVVAIDGQTVLKLFRRLERGRHPEAEVLEALAGGSVSPRLLGVLEDADTTLALVQELVLGVSLGWEGLISRLAAGDGALDDARALGRVTATLHQELARALGTRVGDANDVGVEREMALSDAREPDARIHAALEQLDRIAGARLQRVHGDLHVGQVLRTPSGLVLIDFEGDPSRSLEERKRERSPLVDLASLLLSLDHAGCAAARRESSFDWRAWSREARAACLSGYEGESGAVDAELLRALEVAKELRELVYAERWLPEWLYAPRAVLPTLLEDT